MLTRDLVSTRFHEASSPWLRSLSLQSIKCLIVCRGPVRKEAMEVFDQIGVREYGMLLSEKDSIVYPKCLAPELRRFRFPDNVQVFDPPVRHQQTKLEVDSFSPVSCGYRHVQRGHILRVNAPQNRWQ